MAITTYDELKTAIQDWLDDTNLASKADDFIAVCESRCNRILRAQDMELRTTVSVSGGAADFVALPADFLELREVHLEGSLDEPLAYRWPQFVENIRDKLTGNPIYYSVESKRLTFAAQSPDNRDYSILYYQKIPALASGNPSNWLLTSHPDIYLFGSLVQAEGFLHNDPRILTWKQQFDEAAQELRIVSEYARSGGEPNTRRQPVTPRRAATSASFGVPDRAPRGGVGDA